MIPLEASIVVATCGVVVGLAVLVIGLAKPETTIGQVRRRGADALKLRQWPRRAVIGASLFILIVNIGGVFTAATNNPLVILCMLVTGFIALAATVLALRKR